MKGKIQNQKADILIVSTRKDSYNITVDVQQNLFKILCGI